MDFFSYLKIIMNAVMKLLNTEIVLGGFSFTFLSVLVGTMVLFLVWGAIGKLFK